MKFLLKQAPSPALAFTKVHLFSLSGSHGAWQHSEIVVSAPRSLESPVGKEIGHSPVLGWGGCSPNVRWGGGDRGAAFFSFFPE